MCTIGNVIKGIVTVASIAVPTIKNYNEQKDAINYRTTLALNNMKEAKKEGDIQKQLGIEEARKQKIDGLKRANQLMAQNASGGFAIDSGNNFLGYEDSVNNSYQDASDIQHTYDIRADNYFEKANSYLNEAKSYQKQKKDLKRGITRTALGYTTQVASRWFT